MGGRKDAKDMKESLSKAAVDVKDFVGDKMASTKEAASQKISNAKDSNQDQSTQDTMKEKLGKMMESTGDKIKSKGKEVNPNDESSWIPGLC